MIASSEYGLTKLPWSPRKHANRQGLREERLNPKGPKPGKMKGGIPQFRAAPPNPDFAVALPLSYNRNAPVPNERVCIAEVHSAEVEPRRSSLRAQVTELMSGARARRRPGGVLQGGLSRDAGCAWRRTWQRQRR